MERKKLQLMKSMWTMATNEGVFLQVKCIPAIAQHNNHMIQSNFDLISIHIHD